MGSRSRLFAFRSGRLHHRAVRARSLGGSVSGVGDLIVGNDANGNGGEAFPPNTYACRPPGAYHGPFKSTKGCMLFEIHYYDESKR